MQACTKTHHFEIKKNRKFSGREHLLPRPYPPRCLGRLNILTYGAQAQHDPPPPNKNPSYGLVSVMFSKI